MVSKQSIIDKDEWWGYSSEHGWVVLDRKITTNRPGNPGNLIFLRCSDGLAYEEDRSRWERPYYIFSERYFETLSSDELAQAGELLKKLKEEYKSKKEKFYSSVVQERHRGFLVNRGFATPETKRAKATNRASFCWNCKRPVDNSIDLECTGCGWIICGSCGACGCAYGGAQADYRSQKPSDDGKKQESAHVSTDEGDKSFTSYKEASQYAKENPGSTLTRASDGVTWKVEK